MNNNYIKIKRSFSHIDNWEIEYWDYDLCIKVRVSLRRPHRKWYQSKYIYRKSTDSIDFENEIKEHQLASNLIYEYYVDCLKKREKNEFFKNNT